MILPQVYYDLLKLFKTNGYTLYIVGGTTRDILLGRHYEDYDFATDATIDDMKSFLAIKHCFNEVGSINIEFNGYKVDITTLREESGYIDYRHPANVSFIRDPHIDSLRRDFTINAIYIDEYGNKLDFHSGIDDLNSHIIRMIGDPKIRIEEDPLRILRAIRFSLLLDYRIEDELKYAIKEKAKLLKRLNYSKCLNEIKKMYEIDKERAISLLDYYEISKYIPCNYGFDYIPVIDMHCDTITRSSVEEYGIYNNEDLHVDIKRMMESHYMMQCFAVFVNLAYPNPFNYANKCIDNFEKNIKENEGVITQVYNYQDVMNAYARNKIAALLTIEEGEALEGKLSNIEHFYRRGVRMMSLSWNYPNAIGYPNIYKDENGKVDITHVENEHGLTPFGIEVVRRMNQLGMIIDVSHFSDKGTYDVLNYSFHPIVASHSNSRMVHNVGRNLPDELIKLIAKKHGLIGMNYCPDFVSNSKESQVKDIVSHIKHIRDIAGISCIGLGSDFDGIPTPNGLSDSSKLHLLQEELEKEGFTRDEIEKIFYKNFLRLLKRVCK